MPPRIDKDKLEKRISALSDALANLNSADDLRKLILLIRRPGWTTPAEFTFALGLVDSMLTQTKALSQMKDTLLKGSNAVREIG
ncbi:MAG TPA: hypothetical protein VMW27_01755 [Thermoanaerobaculia bacterium]|nr:hypothetical protein [Thermoanaerobaculia bacterium]